MNYELKICKRTTFLLLLMFLAGTAKAQEASTFESASEAVEHMRLGWNLGNTLESNSGDTLWMWIESNKNRTSVNYETAWGQKVTQAKLFKLFKEAGFNAIRIPVTWYPHMEATFSSVRGYDNNGTWCYTPWMPSKDDIGTKIQRAWMARVHQVVDYVIQQGMYCILNVHHDTGAANTAWLVADEETYTRQHKRFEAIWTQIAEEFRDYDEHLLFEGYNEMLDTDRSWCFAQFGSKTGYNASKAKASYTAINNYAQSFVDAVRATGGNNLQRNLVVCTYGACDGSGTWNSHLQDPLKEMLLPNDVVDGHLIFEVHCYPDISNLTSAKKSIDNTISLLTTHLVEKGAPVIFGEWGISGGENNRNNHVEFVKFFAQRCKANDMGLLYWKGLSEGEHRTVPEFNEQDLVDAMVEGFYGEGGYVDRIETPSISKKQTSRTFDLSGRPSTKRQHGIYLKNGRKYVKGIEDWGNEE